MLYDIEETLRTVLQADFTNYNSALQAGKAVSSADFITSLYTLSADIVSGLASSVPDNTQGVDMHNGVFVSVIEPDSAKYVEFQNRLFAITTGFRDINNYIDLVAYTNFVTAQCIDSATLLGVNAYFSYPPESAYLNKVDNLVKTVYTTGDVKITQDTAFNEDLDIFGSVYVSAGVNLYGHTITVEDSFLHTGGSLSVNGGALKIAHDCTQTGGTLYMKNGNDRIEVGGNYSVGTGNSQSGCLTDGVLTVGGDFEQSGTVTSFDATDISQTEL